MTIEEQKFLFDARTLMHEYGLPADDMTDAMCVAWVITPFEIGVDGRARPTDGNPWSKLWARLKRGPGGFRCHREWARDYGSGQLLAIEYCGFKRSTQGQPEPSR